MLLQGITYTKDIFAEEEDFAVIKQRVEAEKKMFKGHEVAGKTLGVLGLGAIGGMVSTLAVQGRFQRPR